jgi:iron complex outermembrane receptor protein
LTAAGFVNGIPVSLPVGTTVPTVGRGYEAGIKGDLINNTLNFTIAAYQITQENVVQTVTQSINGQGVNITTQGVSIRGNGAEATINWAPNKNWAIVASVSQEDIRNIKEPAGLEYYLGQTVNFSAKTMGSIWSRYNFTSDALRGLWVGGGANYVGKSGGDRRNALYVVPAYTLYNTAIGCDWKWNKAAMSATLNFKNMGNAFYKATPNAVNQPRRLLLSLTTRF